ncbi:MULTISPECIES: S41 family peptidase [unclassified Myroides]|uniref:S41 family peptidase n=1 Tax=unclassified Myroides TaxID=2642485 RepID=UPI003D2F70B4
MKRMVFAVLISVFSFFNCQGKVEEREDPLGGDWKVEFTHPDIGQVRLILSIAVKENTFQAHTRKGADQIILGRWTSFLGRTFTSSFKEGRFITVEEGKITRQDDRMLLDGIFRSPLGNYYFKGTVEEGILQVNLTTKSEVVRATLIGAPLAESLPLADYQGIINQVFTDTEQYLYNRRLIESKAWQRFKSKMKDISAEVHDDLELVFAFYYYAQQLPFSHFALVRGTMEGTTTGGNDKQWSFEDKGKGIGLLTIRSFGGSVEEMREAFHLIEQRNTTRLLVDLRGNVGGSIEAGLTFVNHVATTAYDGGFFLTRQWFVQHSKLPTAAQRSNFTSFSDPNVTALMENIHRQEGIALVAEPSSIARFTGDLYLLVDRKTASTAEPLVYALQAEGRAVVVGEKTAGAMLNSERFVLSEGFTLVLPTADYYTADGKRLDQIGVQPTFDVPGDEALDYVMNQLIKNQ